MAQLAATGDSTKDPTIVWPNHRKVVELGALMVSYCPTTGVHCGSSIAPWDHTKTTLDHAHLLRFLSDIDQLSRRGRFCPHWSPLAKGRYLKGSFRQLRTIRCPAVGPLGPATRTVQSR